MERLCFVTELNPGQESTYDRPVSARWAAVLSGVPRSGLELADQVWRL